MYYMIYNDATLLHQKNDDIKKKFEFFFEGDQSLS